MDPIRTCFIAAPPRGKNRVGRESQQTPYSAISFRRTLSFFGMALLLVLLLLAPVAHADESLLRGPRKSIRANTQSAEPAAEKRGIMDQIASAPVLFYQKFLSPSWRWRCAYYPSCSNYALLAIRKHGAAVGLVMTFDRLQHEADEVRHSPLILAGGEIKVYDPLENNDYWWYIPRR